MRSLALVAELVAEVKVEGQDEAKEEEEIKNSMYEHSKKVGEEMLADYLECEKDVRDLVTNDARKADLRALWKKCDNNGSKKLSTTEFNSFARSEFPLFVQPRANKMAFKLTCQGGDGDEWVNRVEFASLLTHMAFLNKMYFFFDELDSSDDGRVDTKEFGGFFKKLFPAIPDEQRAAIAKNVIEAGDKGGNGTMSFREFVKFTMEGEEKECGIRDLLKPIKDDEE